MRANEFDTTRASCVSTCPVSDLPEVTDPEILPFENNPNFSDTARLTPRMQTALQCLKTAAAGGSPSVGSAYRPPAYNQHLIDVWEKWIFELKEEPDPACADLKLKIQGHFQRHKLLESQPPVSGSLHTLGEAVDVTISLPPANIDALWPGCHLYRPPALRIKDPVLLTPNVNAGTVRLSFGGNPIAAYPSLNTKRSDATHGEANQQNSV